jgi:hypothetical protein
MTLPADGRSKPIRMLSNEVFPAPEWPITAVTPVGISSVTRSNRGDCRPERETELRDQSTANLSRKVKRRIVSFTVMNQATQS